MFQRATEWEGGGGDDSRLLFGGSIAAAKSWLGRHPKNAPAPTTLLLAFIRASEEHDAQLSRGHMMGRATKPRARGKLSRHAGLGQAGHNR